MIEQTATVVRTEGSLAWVEAERQSSCGQCAARKGCGTAVLANVLGRRAARMPALNPVAARPGEQVVIGLDESAMLRGAVVVYLLPLLALIGGAVLASPGGDGLAILGGVGGFLTGLWGLRRFQRRIEYNPRYRPVILRRVQTVGFAVQSLST